MPEAPEDAPGGRSDDSAGEYRHEDGT
jgi:hypothetical protein